MSLTADSLFRTVFLPLYPEDRKGDLDRARTEDANPGRNPSVLAHLGEAANVFARKAPEALGAPLDLDFTDASVHRLSAALTPEARDRLAARGELAQLIIHGAAYVGACVVLRHGGAWAVRRPLWESLVRLRSRAGEAELAVFHWLLKSLADDATATLADRYRAHVELPCLAPEELPVLAPQGRRLPRLAKPRYDTLFKHLRAHLPELRDVGEHFPSPERFDELSLARLDFLLVGGGRMLVLSGPGKGGLHAFWLDREGFEKAAFWPCDLFPEPLLRAADGTDKIEVVLSQDGSTRSFELLWWGP
jgi:hypothetical protein